MYDVIVIVFIEKEATRCNGGDVTCPCFCLVPEAAAGQHGESLLFAHGAFGHCRQENINVDRGTPRVR